MNCRIKSALKTILSMLFIAGILAAIGVYLLFDINASWANREEMEEGEFFPDTTDDEKHEMTARMYYPKPEETLFLKDEVISFTETVSGIPTGKKFSFSIAQLEAMREAILILVSGHLNDQEKVKAGGTTIPMILVTDETGETRIETTKEYETRRRDFLLKWYAQLEREHEILNLLSKSFLEGDWK